MVNAGYGKLSSTLYYLALEFSRERNIEIKWIKTIKFILEITGQADLFYQEEINTAQVITKTKGALEQQYTDEWKATINQSSRLTFYKQIKENIVFEKYLKILPYREALILCHFRKLNHKLAIESKRWLGIDRSERLCSECNCIEDEMHFLFSCSKFNRQRQKFIPRFYTENPNTEKTKGLFAICNKPLLIKLSKYLLASKKLNS